MVGGSSGCDTEQLTDSGSIKTDHAPDASRLRDGSGEALVSRRSRASSDCPGIVSSFLTSSFVDEIKPELCTSGMYKIKSRRVFYILSKWPHKSDFFIPICSVSVPRLTTFWYENFKTLSTAYNGLSRSSLGIVWYLPAALTLTLICVFHLYIFVNSLFVCLCIFSVWVCVVWILYGSGVNTGLALGTARYRVGGSV